MKRWEYRVSRPPEGTDYAAYEAWLNFLGREGWEFACMGRINVTFKREVDQVEQDAPLAPHRAKAPKPKG